MLFRSRDSSRGAVRAVLSVSRWKLVLTCWLKSYIDNANYRDALSLITSLLRELKKLDDKMILTEVHLLESRVHHALANMPKSKVRVR